MSSDKPVQTSNIENNVMAKINSGETTMKPRLYYLTISGLSAVIVLLLGLAISYLMSVVTLWFRIQTAEGPAYGARRNLSNLISAFPWWALILGAIALIFTVHFVRKLGGLYKVRLLYLVPAVILISLTLGFAFSYSNLPNIFKSDKPRAWCSTTNVNCDNTNSGPMHGWQRNN